MSDAPPASRPQRLIAAPAADIFALLCDPQGHVAVDSSGMLQDASGDPVTAAGDSFVVHMDRESLNDFPEMGKYDVTVTIRDFEPDRLISWTDPGPDPPPDRPRLRLPPGAGPGRLRRHPGHVVLRLVRHPPGLAGRRASSRCISEDALRASLGILDRTVRRGYPRPTPD